MHGPAPEFAPLVPSRFMLPKADRGVLERAQRERALAIVGDLLSAPTAPYAEDLVLLRVRRRFAGRGEFQVQLDASANLLVTYRGGAASLAPPRPAQLAFSAHLDHPGFLLRPEAGGKHVASFHGGVPARYFPGSRVRFFAAEDGRDCGTAQVHSVEALPSGEVLATLEQVAGEAFGAGTQQVLGMWDLPAGVMRGTRLHARVCDDLMGAAAIIAVLEDLAAKQSPTAVLGIFTRAEETGFIGCQGLLRGAHDLAATYVVGLECSPARVTAKVGAGVVLRVGDAASVFDPHATHVLQDCARALQRERAGFRFQRALMDGGRCESTAYNLWGVRAAGLCLALGNYHNCGRGNEIAPEYVDWNDFEDLIALLGACAERFEHASPAEAARQRLQRVWDSESALLLSSAERIRARLQPARDP